MDYTIYRITCPPEVRDIVLALLADAGLEAFEETPYGLDAYAPQRDNQQHQQAVEAVSRRFALTFRKEGLIDQNWNERWERNFHPIRIGDRVRIRATFHQPDPTVDHELVIDPRMAFGTGHHATTHLMCELILEEFSRHPPARVLDYGSGTGVLAILAGRCGAGLVHAVDIEAPAAESTRENAELNGVALDLVVHGELADVPVGQGYDLILANINRNVLLATGAALYERLRTGGRLLASGILEPDADLLVGHMRSLGLRHRETRAREDWRAFVFVRD